MGKTLRRIGGVHQAGWRAAALSLAACLRRLAAGMLLGRAFAAVVVAGPVVALFEARMSDAQVLASPLAGSGNVRLDSGRFTVVASSRDVRLANAMLGEALARDTFPGLPRPRRRLLIAIAGSATTFRQWVGPNAPEWGAAVAMPDAGRVVMQGSYGNSDAGNPVVVLRHELAHMALHEFLGELPPRWFDEGYASVAAAEWDRANALETTVGLTWRSLPDANELDDGFYAGASRAQFTYALAHLAVAEMQGIDVNRGLANFFQYWRETGSYELAVRQAFGLTSSGFDAYWHKRVRARYGALALVANLSLAFGFVAMMLGPMYWSKRRRNRQRLEEMRAVEALQEAAARRSALAAMLALERTMRDGNIEATDDRSPHSLDTSGSPV